MPIAIVNHFAGLRGLITQIFRKNAHRVDEGLAIGDVKAIAIEICEHPFVRIEAITVRELKTVVNPTKFRAERGCS